MFPEKVEIHRSKMFVESQQLCLVRLALIPSLARKSFWLVRFATICFCLVIRSCWVANVVRSFSRGIKDLTLVFCRLPASGSFTQKMFERKRDTTTSLFHKKGFKNLFGCLETFTTEQARKVKIFPVQHKDSQKKTARTP